MSEHVTDLTGSWTSALAADALMDALNGAHDHGRSTVFTSNGSVIATMIPRELFPPAVPDTTNAPGWNGWRLTLNCAHLLLTDQDNWHIGKLVPCDMDRPTRQMRVIVDRQPVHAPAAPELLASAYWYGT